MGCDNVVVGLVDGWIKGVGASWIEVRVRMLIDVRIGGRTSWGYVWRIEVLVRGVGKVGYVVFFFFFGILGWGIVGKWALSVL